MHSEVLAYEADGLSMKGELFFDPQISGPRPGVLVFPEAFGLSENALSRAERLAQLGYVALACDLYGDRAQIDDLATVMERLGELKAAPSRVHARAKGALDALLTRVEVDPAQVAAIGYCFGGTLALELARSGGAIVAAVGLHSGLEPVDLNLVPDIKGKVLACIGADDPSIDQTQRNAFEAEMRKAEADWQLHVYGGVVHSFTSPDADARGVPHFARYDAAADQRSWAAMTNLFDEVFG